MHCAIDLSNSWLYFLVILFIQSNTWSQEADLSVYQSIKKQYLRTEGCGGAISCVIKSGRAVLFSYPAFLKTCCDQGNTKKKQTSNQFVK